MCLKPIYVTIRPKVYQIGDFRGKSYEMPVPCGKCAQCLKKRQGEYRSRVLLNSQKYPYCYFVTLTYNEENVPVYQRIIEIDRETGELSNAHVYDELQKDSFNGSVISRDCDGYFDIRQKLNEVPKGVRVRSICQDLDYGFGLFRFYYSDSLDYGDVQKYLKRLRSAIDYQFGKDGPKLSYLTCGEYGPVTHRPHFHLLIMLDKPIEHFKRTLKETWKLGYVDVREVGCTSQDFGKVGSYISKYIVKGKKNEEPAALDGFCVRPRVRSSIGFGSYLTHAQIFYLRCYDLYGPYSMFEHEKVFDNEDKKTLLFMEMAKRFRCLFTSTSTPITKSLLKRLFSVRTPGGNVCWSPVYLEFRNFARDLAISRHDEQYRQYCSDFGYAENSLDSFVAFEAHLQSLADVKQARFETDSNAFYKRSKV